jgi:hypothetical protein
MESRRLSSFPHLLELYCRCTLKEISSPLGSFAWRFCLAVWSFCIRSAFAVAFLAAMDIGAEVWYRLPEWCRLADRGGGGGTPPYGLRAVHGGGVRVQALEKTASNARTSSHTRFTQLAGT